MASCHFDRLDLALIDFSLIDVSVIDFSVIDFSVIYTPPRAYARAGGGVNVTRQNASKRLKM